MWSRLSILCALSCVALCAPLTSTPCPESCECVELKTGHLETTCSSLKFLEKLQPKQVNAIVSLDLSNKNLTQLHSKLKKLRNLQRVNLANNNLYDINEISFLPKLTYLNLKSNHIKYFTVSSLSKYLKHLDISHNYLTYIPQEFASLPGLKEVNLYDNPISCTCDTLKERDLLLAAGITLVKPVICHSPEKLRGQLLQTVSCTKLNDDPLDHLQGDEPAVEGSGDEPETLLNEDVFDDPKSSNLETLEQEQFLQELPKTTEPPVVEDEGSGDSANATSIEEDEYEDYEEASGDDELIQTTVIPPVYIRPKACNFDCSTPLPLDEFRGDNGTDPDILGEIGKGIQEIFPFGNEPKPSTTEEPSVQEEVIDKVVINPAGAAAPDEKSKIEEAIDGADANEIKEPNKSGVSTNLIIIIALIVIMLCLVAFSIIKKRSSRKNRPKVIEQEMKPLNSKPTNSSCSIPEKTPLMNGQNGNMNGKPVEEPVGRSEELDPRAPPPEDDVDLRKKNKDEEHLLPGTHRVTIQAKELSTPKTPLLVNRVRSGDGQFVTTSLDSN